MCRALIALADELYSAWEPLMNRRLISRIPEALSGRLARLRVARNVTMQAIRECLEAAAVFRRRLRALANTDETLEAAFEQQLRLRDARNVLVQQGAQAQVGSIEALATHPHLGPQRMDLVPDGRSHVANVRSTPDGVLHHAEIPDHLRGMGAVERLEITMVTEPVQSGDLARRIAEAIRTKVRGTDGVSQLTTPLRVAGQDIPQWGTVMVHVPPSVTLDSSVANTVHSLLGASGANTYANYRAMQRFLLYQPATSTRAATWFSAVRTGPDDFAISAL